MEGVNDTPPIATSYVSHVVAVSPVLAQQVFDACRADRRYRSSVPTRWLVPAGVRDVLVVAGDDAIGLELVLRRCPGVLRAGLRRWKVELELAPWSSSASELGIRFVSRWPITERAHEAASEVLDVLAAELELRALLARHPDHVTGSERPEVSASAWL
jgi:hypothetical protein